MINLYKKFVELNRNIKDSQKLINLDGVVKAYYGINKDGFFRISFLSKDSPNIKGTTKNIEIVQGNSGDNNYWTCFDLKNDTLLSAFCIFGEDLISCVYDEKEEYNALTKLRVRFNTWLALFKKSRTPLSLEKAKGLYGELYFINEYMIEKYGADNAIDCWSGPEMYSKDFSIEKTWYEIKTVNTGSATIKISSIQQLSSDFDGHLIVIKVEEMSDSFDVDKSSINKLCQLIISKIDNSETKDMFLNRLSELGYDFCDDIGNKNYQVHEMTAYLVNSDFPIVREVDIKSEAINNVGYELVLKLINDYKEKIR
jgi:hypothetical protein